MIALPEFYASGDAGRLYLERADRAIAAGRELAKRGMPPADSDRFRVCAFGIDVQVGFCLPGASLFVPGAVEDTTRALGFLYENLKRITSLVLSQDTHTLRQIFFADYWIDENGEHPAAFTVIRAKDVRAGRLRSRFDPEASLEYLEKLELASRTPLTIWPYHTLRGGTSHALVPALMEAALFSERRGTPCRALSKRAQRRARKTTLCSRRKYFSWLAVRWAASTKVCSRP